MPNVQDMGNSRLINVIDPVDPQDAMTNNTSNANDNAIPRAWINGVRKSQVKEFYSSAVVSAGTVVFYLTDDGTATGNAIFTTIYTESINLNVFDGGNSYSWGSLSIAGNKKSITLTINKLGFTSDNFLLNLLGNLSSALTGVQWTSAANGLTVYLQVKGE